MNDTLKAAAVALGVVASVAAGLVYLGKGRNHRNIEAICEARVKQQIENRAVQFREPVHTFIDSGEYLLHWNDLRVANRQGLMEQRKVMCSVRRDGGDWQGQASFIDGEALR
jgi:hypothetical protein